MKFEASKKELSRVFKILGQVINGKAKISSHLYVKFTVNEDGILATGRYYKDWICCKINGTIHENGEELLEFSTLKDIVKSSPIGSSIAISFQKVEVNPIGIVRLVRSIEPCDWENRETPSNWIDAGDSFVNGLLKAWDSVSIDDSRKSMHCIRIENHETIATNGHELFHTRNNVENLETPINILPSKALKCLEGKCQIGFVAHDACKEDKEREPYGIFFIKAENAMASFEMPCVMYPNWRLVVPSESSLKGNIKLSDVESLMKTIPILTENKCIKIIVESGKARVAATDIGVSEGLDGLEIWLKATGLSSALKREMVEMHVTDAYSPIVLRGSGDYEVLMPMRKKI